MKNKGVLEIQGKCGASHKSCIPHILPTLFQLALKFDTSTHNLLMKRIIIIKIIACFQSGNEVGILVLWTKVNSCIIFA